MADLLQRERQLHRLNERFNSLHKTEYPPEVSSTEAKGDYSRRYNKNVNDRYATYTRNKGPSTLLKKRGEGDVSDNMDRELKVIPPQRTTDRFSKARHDDVPIIVANARKPTGNRSPPMQHHMALPTSVEEAKKKVTANRHHFEKQFAAIGKPRQTPRNDNPFQSPHALPPKYKKPVSMPKKAITDTDRIYKLNHQYHEAHFESEKPEKEKDSPIQSMNNSDYYRYDNAAVVYFNNCFVESPSLEEFVQTQTVVIGQEANLIVSQPTAGEDKKERARTNASNEGLIKYLKAKIGVLEGDHKRLCEDMSQQKLTLERAVEAHKKVIEQRDRAIAKQHTLKIQLAKLEVQLQEANQRIKDQSTQQIDNSKELVATKREIKILTQANAKLERRIARLTEELAITKNALEAIKKNDQSIKELSRIENEGKDKQIKALKKQRGDLFNAYKKQLFLIENLKRQNICLEQSRMVGIGEREFSKVLDWTSKSG